MSVILRWPNFKDIKQLKKAQAEPWEKNFLFLHYFETLANADYEKYIKILPQLSNTIVLPQGHVPCTFLLVFNKKNEIVGRASIRHDLDDFLSKVAGHIGYGVVPSYRKNGYATQILTESLNYVRLNLSHLREVLLTCDDDNIGSIKTIEKNNGKLIDKYEGPELRSPIRRYKIIIPTCCNLKEPLKKPM